MAGANFQLPDFLRDDAFALRMGLTQDGVPAAKVLALRNAGRKKFRVKYMAIVVLIVVLALLSLCIGFDNAGTEHVKLCSPLDVLKSLWVWVQVCFIKIFDSSQTSQIYTLIETAPMYQQVIQRAGITLATLVCGALLASAGMLYQTVFRNPIASPSLLGITNGVQVGLLIMLAGFGTGATYYVGLRFAYGYIAGFIVLIIVFLLSKLISGRRKGFNVFDMLVVGTIMSSFLGALAKYILDFMSQVHIWTLFFEFQEGLTIYNSPITYIVLFAAMIVSFVPIFILRFHLNLLSFSDGEVKVMGGNPHALRALSLISGSIMILTAQVFVGPASSFALVVPFIARLFFGAEFKKQLCGNVLLGMLILLICRDLSALIPFVGIGIPIGTIAGLVTLPIFVWATALSAKAWE